MYDIITKCLWEWPMDCTFLGRLLNIEKAGLPDHKLRIRRKILLKPLLRHAVWLGYPYQQNDTQLLWVE
jgi:hypothetical protein